MKAKREKCVVAELRKLAVEGKVSFPYERSNYVKSVCVSYGRLWQKSFSVDTTTNRSLIIVTRTA